MGDFHQVARDLVASMTLEECIDLLSGSRGLHSAVPWLYRLADYPTRPLPRLDVQALRFTDGPKGVNLGHSTCFPVAIARGASWDPDLEMRIGHAMATEALAHGANTLGSTCINVVRHPGWGRTQETYGADTVLLSAMGAALVRGIQGGGVMAVVKHFALNSIENSRFKVNVQIDERALQEVYLPHFRACVEAGAAGIMSAYNKVNGQHCDRNEQLLRQILKHDWGFRGFVMSDFLLGTHGTAAPLRAGLDMEMPHRFWFTRHRIKRCIHDGDLQESQVRGATQRVLGQLGRFGLIGPKKDKPPASVVASKEHRALALDSARRSIVLLKNEGDMLPLNPIRRLAVIGRLARKPNLGSEGSISVKPPETVTLMEGLRRQFPDVELVFDNGRNTNRAAHVAESADAAVMCFGMTGRDEGEYFPLLGGGDRTQLELPDAQIRLIEAVTSAQVNSVGVMFGGSAIACGDWRHKLPALLMAWYPGMYGGVALAEILAGKTHPSGRLPISFPQRTGDLPSFDPESDQVSYDLYHDYRWLDREEVQPAFPLGHGLGFAPVHYRDIKVTLPDPDASHPEVTVCCWVENTGDCDADEVVQLYLSVPHSTVERVARELKAFRRVTIPAGERVQVEFALGVRELSYFDQEAGDWQVEATQYEARVGPSAAEQPLRQMFQLKAS